jgi:hypothetical protein
MIDDAPWEWSAACADTGSALFDPITKSEWRRAGNVAARVPRVTRALAVCAGCPVVAQCRARGASYTDIALEGTYGGQYVGGGEARKRMRIARVTRGKSYLHDRRPMRPRGANRDEAA